MKNVLLVDDSPFVGLVLRDLLGGLDIDVHVARDLWDLERYKGTPDLVLMDVVLQEAFGDDIAGLFAATRDWQAPIYLLSSLPDDELAARTAEAKLDGYLSKRIGFAAISERVRALLALPATPPKQAPDNLAFDVVARQRVRRVRHLLSRSEYWNAAGMIAELHALVGDAELIGATEIAELARGAKQIIEQHGRPSPEIGAAMFALAQRVGVAATNKTLLILETDDFCRRMLLGPLDRKNHLVLEARSLAEVRQKLRATSYDLIVLDADLERAEPEMRREVEAYAPMSPIAVVERTLEPEQLIDRIERLMAP